MQRFFLSQPAVRAGFALLLSGILALPAAADRLLDRVAFADTLGDRQSSFLARDLATGERCILAGSDLDTRHAPWSTFKIPNTLIALETGVAAGTDDWRDWDPAARPAAGYWPEAWRQGQTLGSAFQRSAVWYYRDLALEVGAPQYRAILMDWDYGNAEVPDGSDDFWLGAPLEISVTEQVRFLERLLSGDISLGDEHLAGLIEVAEAGPIGDLTLYGKTGAGTVVPGQFSGPFEGWYVGWLMRDGAATAVFAHHAVAEDFSAIRSFRKDFAETLLLACGLAGDQG
ncbi:MAG: penicillin-binding transpeptidase domain-containing protein [Pseudomonadota bacterium]